MLARNDLLAVEVETEFQCHVLRTKSEHKTLWPMRALRITACWDAHWNFPSSSKSFRCQKQAARPSNSSSGHFKYDRNLRGWQHKKHALRHQATSERVATSPQFGVEGGLLYLESPGIEPNTYGALMFGLEWTPTMAALQKAKASSLHSKANSVARTRADTVAAVRLAVQNRWRDEQESRMRIPVAAKAIEQAEENLRAAKVRFQQGAAINTEVLDAETLRTRTYNNYYDAVYEAVLSTFRLRRAVGTL